MGYTHYYRTPKTLGTAKEFKAFTDDAKVIFALAAEKGIKLGNGLGYVGTKPKVTASKVWFNGVDADSHETLAIDRVYEEKDWSTAENGLYFNFCKTARKPYDVVCVAILLLLQRHFPSVQLSSDGGENEWSDGQALLKEALGVEQPVGFSKD